MIWFPEAVDFLSRLKAKAQWSIVWEGWRCTPDLKPPKSAGEHQAPIPIPNLYNYIVHVYILKYTVPKRCHTISSALRMKERHFFTKLWKKTCFFLAILGRHKFNLCGISVGANGSGMFFGARVPLSLIPYFSSWEMKPTSTKQPNGNKIFRFCD